LGRAATLTTQRHLRLRRRSASRNYTLKLTLAEAAEVKSLLDSQKAALEKLIPSLPSGTDDRKALETEYGIVERLWRRI
jgi:hypothetical protein